MRRLALFGALALCWIAASASVTDASSGLAWSGYTWHVMSGTGGLGQKWSASHVKVASDGTLHILVSGGVGGGISMSHDQTYGVYSAKFRMTKGTGKPVFLLWPQTGKRPEIDWAEGRKGDAARLQMTGTYHPTMTTMIHVSPPSAIDYSQWHTFGVTWRSTGVTFTCDGKTWAHLSNTSHVPMHMSIQANWKSGTSQTPAATLEIAHVSVGK